MSVINSVRRQSFWALDFLKGSKIIKRVNDIAFILEKYQDPESVNLRTSRLENLIKHATETVPFYMELENVRRLSDFPIINKNLIRDNFDAFRSSEFNGVALFPKYTSGSTGTPFRIYH